LCLLNNVLQLGMTPDLPFEILVLLELVELHVLVLASCKPGSLLTAPA
jgi:hypothetical protein